MIRAAGILCVAPNGHVLLVHRTDGQGWAFPGGRIEDGESAEDAARREFQEETGQECEGKLMLWTRSLSGYSRTEGVESDVDFTTFIARCSEFEPKLNEEHDSWQWVDRQFALNSGQLHPGCYIALRRFDMDELDIAKAIRDGELASPQRYKNMLLIAMRITGTGVAYRNRDDLDEYVWRDPSMYMTSEFLERCNGLPVLLEHPKENVLDTQGFRSLMVGTVFLPYLKADVNEVWGISKILDLPASQMLEDEPMSTSPGVVVRKADGLEYEMKNGSTLLIEGKPVLLDHLAICARGVWDKGGDPRGVDSIDTRADSIDSLESRLCVHQINQMHRRVSRVN